MTEIRSKPKSTEMEWIWDFADAFGLFIRLLLGAFDKDFAQFVAESA
jgi:hypothetical protein